MLNSMTGFANGKGNSAGLDWSWDLRGVNSKGLDLRLRCPDWIEGLEQRLRSGLSKEIARGALTLSLRVSAQEETTGIAVNAAVLSDMLSALEAVESDALARGISLAPSKPSDIMAMRGVIEAKSEETDPEALREALLAELPKLIESFNEMRQAEGQALKETLDRQLKEIKALTSTAKQLAEARKDEMADTLRSNLARVLENSEGVDEARLTQELALLAVKSDVTEEIDRLGAHVDAAHALIAQGSPVGRKLDFLMQEFNREANTLCSKSQNVELTRVGLDLKATIDQMREQVQNVE